jgi:hypothetical protein
MDKLKADKRGSATVLLCITLSSILLLIGFVGEAASRLALKPHVDTIFDLAGRSILSEYDRTLKSRYGIFAFVMDEEEAEEKIARYMEGSLKKKSGSFNLLSATLEEVEVDFSQYVMTNLKRFEDQIIEQMRADIVDESLKILDLAEIMGDSNKVLIETDSAFQDGDEKNKGRTLRNEEIINSLPSRLLSGIDGGFVNLLEMPSPKDMGRIGYEELCLNSYILKHFNSGRQGRKSNSFFLNEVEYILCGKLSDDLNRRIVYLSLLAFRTAINSSHIKGDTSKMGAVTLAAALTGGGNAAEATIIGIWAGAEAVNDMKRLERGDRVPLFKTSDDWFLDLSTALEGNLDCDGPKVEDKKGLSYEDYLFLLLCFKKKEGKLIRMMDLIQLNIKGDVNEDFTAEKCMLGLRMSVKLKRETIFPAIWSTKRRKIVSEHVY